MEDSSSESFLPTSLFVHSSALSPEVELIPGTTRGMMCDFVRFFYVVVCEVKSVEFSVVIEQEGDGSRYGLLAFIHKACCITTRRKQEAQAQKLMT